MPFLTNAVLAPKITLSSSADLAAVTISLALQTVLMEDSERLDASRCATKVSRGTSTMLFVDRICEFAGDNEVWL